MSRRHGRIEVRFLAVAAVLLAAGVLSACAGPAREQVGSPGELGGGETLIVGRVELVPPLRPGEQKIRGGNAGSFENKMFWLTDENDRVLTKAPELADFTGRIEAILGQNFFVRSSARPFYIIGGMMYLELGGREMSRAYFPGGLKVSVRSGDKAVYIGTVQYHRNEFFEVTKTAIVDDYDRVNAEYRKKFGTKSPLRKALVTRTK